MNQLFAPVPRSLREEEAVHAAPQAFALVTASDSLRRQAEISAALLGSICSIRINTESGYRIRVDGDTALSGEQYRLECVENHARICAGSPEGVSRAFSTLCQLFLSGRFHELRIDDGPALARRGYMLDVSRDRVPARRTLLYILDALWLLKVNELQLYVEHTYAFAGHEEVWRDASPLTKDDILWLEDQCAARSIELVPNLNSLGHFGRWLSHPSYRWLSECPDGCTLPNGRVMPVGGTTLFPCPETLDFLASLYDEYLPLFSSKCCNGGMDEPWELGLGRSRAACETLGKHRVYLDHLAAVARMAEKHGKAFEFWADIVLEKPECVPQLPAGITGMIWGYEKGHPFESHCAAFEKAGVPFVACPGTTGWNSLCGRWENARSNIAEAVRACVAHGGTGLLLTDWGDNGHHQSLPVTLPPLVLAASLAWNPDEAPNVEDAIDSFLARDSARLTGRLLTRLASAAERHFSLRLHNTSPAWKLFFAPAGELAQILPPADAAKLPAFREELAFIAAELDRARPEGLGGTLVRREIALAVRMTDFGACRALAALGSPQNSPDSLESIAIDYEELWLARSQRGGLRESLARITAIE